jgi:hypothetical protein
MEVSPCNTLALLTVDTHTFDHLCTFDHLHQILCTVYRCCNVTMMVKMRTDSTSQLCIQDPQESWPGSHPPSPSKTGVGMATYCMCEENSQPSFCLLGLPHSGVPKPSQCPIASLKGSQWGLAQIIADCVQCGTRIVHTTFAVRDAHMLISKGLFRSSCF